MLALRPNGKGVLLTVAVVLLTGVFVSNLLGQKLLRLWEGILKRIPVVNSIYGGVKQVSDTLFAPGGPFRNARHPSLRMAPTRRSGSLPKHRGELN